MTAAAAKLAKPISLPLRLAAWSVGPAAIAAVHFAMLELHPLARMWALAGTLFFWMKAVVLVERSHAGKPAPSPMFPWLLLWPGMRPVARAPSPVAVHIAQGVTCLAAGTACLFAARLVWFETASLWATAPLIMVGFSLCLHFGLFALLTAGWRAAGFKAGPLFRNPLASRSLDDFWSRRWNLAYVEMCQETVLRLLKTSGRENAKARNVATAKQPQIHTDEHGLSKAAICVNLCESVVPKPFALSRFRGSKQFATGAIFPFSGLLHETAISLPVNAGYGLPTLYFVLNGAAMLVGRKFKDGGPVSRAWAAFWVIAPLPLLFHPWFIRGVMLPLVGITA